MYNRHVFTDCVGGIAYVRSVQLLYTVTKKKYKTKQNYGDGAIQTGSKWSINYSRLVFSWDLRYSKHLTCTASFCYVTQKHGESQALIDQFLKEIRLEI